MLTALALLLMSHLGIVVAGVLQGAGLEHPWLTRVECVVAAVSGLVGFGFLVAGAEPFDESELPPLLQHEQHLAERVDRLG